MDAADRVRGVGVYGYNENNGDGHGVDDGDCDDEGFSDQEDLLKSDK